MTNTSSQPLAFDDIALATEAKQGDKGAFTELVNRYAQRVFRVARHITKNDQDAEDVLQDTFLKAYSRLGQFEGNAKFYTWIVRVAVNEALMRMRRGKNRVTVSLDQELETSDGAIQRELPAETESPEESLSRTELRESLTQAIDSLSETYRPVFVLRDVEGLSTEETAEMLNLSLPAVKSRLLRARLQLRQKLRRFLKKDDRQEENHV
ncbi:MAG: RNA polymerase sigma factor [Bryobacterales bacterium]|nr:RNA polymerase sigma factor [Bryobacterales bacterium]MDE0294727.1 RNA polymerase sigma factor [Bryobacterales bacterium]MDE0433678.1 RNA polymerase sigma factor [Bryobacterales bacterium]